jgi:hypothetical protein
MAEYEAAEEERITNLKLQHELLTGAMTDHQAAVAEAFGLMDAGAEEEVPNLAEAMGGLAHDTDLARASMEGLKSAIDALPDEKEIRISATYEAPEPLQPESPKLGLQHMLERLVAFAVGNPVDVRAELDGGFGGFGGGAGPGVSRTEIGATTYNVYDRAALELVEDQARRERRAPLGTLMGA